MGFFNCQPHWHPEARQEAQAKDLQRQMSRFLEEAEQKVATLQKGKQTMSRLTQFIAEHVLEDDDA